ncbi:MAG: hypothetical protein A2934_02060 [Candidatus Sungbacteria bacterium RIFCSPLOWO2_01_FULL_47_10]|uniref:Dihydrofolate reductase n=1 Tax=Candidatus Sungbacteria bacterium RIFCSPLOWO2_01_FULL_47_10 TaxID=1802276 RepID=A0A1G2KY33_9BACT|nr:MAG: hypothetical protein A2934_02060 [Candidatus Sungbacteria bacterium RIFCSPLOWO2_01_FULL_47_10]
MNISLIVALDINRLIGVKNGIPWHLPADLWHFKSLTVGKPIIMGSTTHETIGKPLPERVNIVITRKKDYLAEGCVIVSSVEGAIAAAENALKEMSGNEIMIIGGGEVYRQFLHRANRMYLTRIDYEFHGDTYFPEWSPDEWQEVSREEHEPDEKNLYRYAFVVLERKE